MSDRWEYKIIESTGDKTYDFASEGKEGWKLCAVLDKARRAIPVSSGTTYPVQHLYFKRKLPSMHTGD